MILRTLAFTAALTTAVSAHVQLITVTMSDNGFAPNKIELLKDSDYELQFVNTSGKAQDFSALALFDAGAVETGDRDKIKDGTVKVEPGRTVELRFMPKNKGTYPVRGPGAAGTAVVE